LDIVDTNIEHIASMEVIMETALETRIATDSLVRSTGSSAFHRGAACVRCGGLMIREFCMDLLNSTGELEIQTLRCVQCGDVVDPVILRNRLRLQEVMPSTVPTIALQSLGGQVVA